MEETGNASNVPPRERQTWTQSGHPIVAGKFLDQDGIIKDIGPDENTLSGPPVIEVYWHNRKRSPNIVGQFGGIVCSSFVSVTEYFARLGAFFNAHGDSCEIMAINATQYSINVIVATELSQQEMGSFLREFNLRNAH